MADLELLKRALKNADAAGDTAAAQKLADALRQQMATPTAQPAPAPQPDPGAEPGVPLSGMGPDGGNLDWTDPGYVAAAQPRGRDGPPQFVGEDQRIPRPLVVGAQGAGRGLANLAGLPVDLATAGINLGVAGAEGAANLFLDDEDEISLPRSDRPIGGSENIASTAGTIADTVGVPLVDPAEMTTAERGVYNINALGTEALAGGAGLARAAARRFARPNTAPSAADGLLRPYAETPGRTAAQDIGAAAAGGSALTAAQELPADGPVNRSVAEFLSTLFGGVTGAQVADLGMRAVPAAGRAATRQGAGGIARDVPLDDQNMPTRNRVADKAAARLKGDMSDDRARSIADTIAETVRGFLDDGLPVPTTGAIAGDPQMAQLEVGARTRNPVQFMRRDTQIKGAAADRIGSIGEGGDPEQARAFARDVDATRRLEAELSVEPATAAAERAAEDVTAAQRQAQEFGRGARPANTVGVKQGASAAFFRNATEDTLDPMTAAKNARFDAPQAGIDIEPLAEVAQKVEDGLSKLRAANFQAPVDVTARIKKLLPETTETPTGVLDDAGNPVTRSETTGGTVEWQELSKLRRDLSLAQTKAREAGSFELADTIGDLKRGIDDEADALGAAGGRAGEQIAEAQRYYREVYAPVWAQPGSPNMALRDSVQRNKGKIEPEKALELYNLTGQPTPRAVGDLRNIIRASKNPAEAKAAVSNYVAADLGSSVIDYEGNVDIPKLRSWIEDRQALLRDTEFADIKQQVDELLAGAVNNRDRVNALEAAAKDQAEALRGAEANRDASLRRLDDAALRLVIDRTPSKAVAGVFGAEDPPAAMREIVGDLSGNEAALAGWRRAVAEHVQQRVQTTKLTPDGDREVSVAKLIQNVDAMRPTLEEAFTPEQLNSLQQARKLLEPYQNLSARAASGSDTAQKLSDKLSEVRWATFSLASRLYAGVLKGGGITRTAKDAVGRFANDDDAVNDLLVRTLTDPELAAHLLRRPGMGAAQAEWNDRLYQLLGVQQATTEDGGEREPLSFTVRPSDAQK